MQITKPDKPILLYALVLSVTLLSVLFQSIGVKQALLFVLGLLFGMVLLRTAFGFSGGWRRFIREQRSDGLRAQLLLLCLSSVLFFPFLGGAVSGVHVNPALAPVGLSVMVGAFLFGIGMQLGGGCGSGTLFTVGEGQVDMLVTLLFFIIGATLGSAHLGWWLSLPAIAPVSLIESMTWSKALLLQLMILAILYHWVRRRELLTHNKLRPIRQWWPPLGWQDLLYGRWPVSWGILGLALLGLATLLIAGHPWSITFAFGLWGSKLWSAVGGHPESWHYWASGYPAQALQSSVLADTTSVMDLGIILGSLVAAAMMGRYAPAMSLSRNRLFAAVLGGLMLGYGARLAFGCNIGALLGGIASGSLHGWLWMVMAFSGSMLGVRWRIRLSLDKAMVNHGERI